MPHVASALSIASSRVVGELVAVEVAALVEEAGMVAADGVGEAERWHGAGA